MVSTPIRRSTRLSKGKEKVDIMDTESDVVGSEQLPKESYGTARNNVENASSSIASEQLPKDSYCSPKNNVENASSPIGLNAKKRGRPAKAVENKARNLTTSRSSVHYYRQTMDSIGLREEHRILIRQTIFGQFLEMPCLSVDISLLDKLIAHYNGNCVFKIGNRELKCTEDDLGKILGLPTGNDLRKICLNFKRKELTELEIIVFNGSSGTLHRDAIKEKLKSLLSDSNRGTCEVIVKMWLLLLFASVLFTKSNFCCSSGLIHYIDLNHLDRYNWSRAIHCIIFDGMEELSKKIKMRGPGLIKAGYLNGCAIALNIWLYETLGCFEPTAPLEHPPFRKWFNTHRTGDSLEELLKKGQVNEVLFQDDDDFVTNENFRNKNNNRGKKVVYGNKGSDVDMLLKEHESEIEFLKHELRYITSKNLKLRELLKKKDKLTDNREYDDGKYTELQRKYQELEEENARCKTEVESWKEKIKTLEVELSTYKHYAAHDSVPLGVDEILANPLAIIPANEDIPLKSAYGQAGQDDDAYVQTERVIVSDFETDTNEKEKEGVSDKVGTKSKMKSLSSMVKRLKSKKRKTPAWKSMFPKKDNKKRTKPVHYDEDHVPISFKKKFQIFMRDYREWSLELETFSFNDEFCVGANIYQLMDSAPAFGPVVECFLESLRIDLKKNADLNGKILICSTYVSRHLEGEVMLMSAESLKIIGKYFKLRDIKYEEVVKIIFPLYTRYHWHFMEVDLEKKKLVSYNSIRRNPHHRIACEHWVNWIKKFARTVALPRQLSQWQLEYDVTFPEQSEYSLDCGIFMMKGIECRVFDRPITFKQSSIGEVRVGIAAKLIAEGNIHCGVL